VATEHWVGDFKLDVLCTDGDEQVIIENQLEKPIIRTLGKSLPMPPGSVLKGNLDSRVISS